MISSKAPTKNSSQAAKPSTVVEQIELCFLLMHRLTVINQIFFSSADFSGAFAGNSRKFRTEFLQDVPTPGTGPYFDTTVSSNVTGLVGKTVHLICKVKNLGNRTVSQIEFH